MRGSQTKIKVNVQGLLKAVQARRVKMVEEHKTAVAAHRSSKAEYQAKVVSTLREAADRAERGKLPEAGWRSLEIPLAKQRIEKPVLDLGRIDRLIKTLKLASDETIIISADDAAEYLG